MGWLIAVAIDEVVVIRHSLRTGRDGTFYCVRSETLDVVEAPLVRGILPVVIAVSSAFAAYHSFVSQRPVIEDLMLGIMVAVGWLAHRLGGLLGDGLAVEGRGIQPFLVAVAYVDASVVEDGLFQVSGEAVAGLIRPLALAHLDKELGVVGVGDAFAVQMGMDETGC